jgi:hypothetical protein
MTVGLGFARVIVLLGGVTLLLLGLASIVFGGPGIAITGLWLVGIGIACIVGTLIERVRYRSDATDRAGLPTGRAGGEPVGTRLEPRFRRSDEVFVDPTSGHRMRVWLDPSNGERRYVTED